MQGVTSSATSTSVQHQRFQQAVDDLVLHKAKQGDERAQAILYQTYSRAVYTLALGICSNQQCAEDVLHNTFIKFISNLPSYEGRAPLGMWLRKIAVNESLMYLRKHKKHKVVVSSDEHAFLEDMQIETEHQAYPTAREDFTHQHDEQCDMSALLQKLPEDMRKVLWLKEVEGYTHDEIASMMNKTPSYSKSTVSRAIQFLRARVSSEVAL